MELPGDMTGLLLYAQDLSLEPDPLGIPVDVGVSFLMDADEPSSAFNGCLWSPADKDFPWL